MKAKNYRSSGGGSGVRGTYVKAGAVVKRGAGGRFMGSIKFRGDTALRQGRSGLSTGIGAPSFRETRSAYAYHTQSARGQTDAQLRESLKFHRQFTHTRNTSNRRPEFRQAVAGAAVQREMRRRGYGVVETRSGLQIHSPESGRNTGAKAAKSGKTVVHNEKPIKRPPGVKVGAVIKRGSDAPLYKAQIQPNQAANIMRQQVRAYRQESPSSLGGALSKTSAKYKKAASEGRWQNAAQYGIENRAIVRVVAEQRRAKVHNETARRV